MMVMMESPKDMPRWQVIGYWVSTVLAGLAFLNGAFGNLTRADYIVEGSANLGYPDFLSTILGVAYLFGAIALLVPMFPRLKEWAYAGLTFAMLGAISSHILAGDPISSVVAPLIFLILVAVSYYFHLQRTK